MILKNSIFAAMRFIDTHSHIYLKEFDEDRDQVVQSAVNRGVEKIILPNVDQDTVSQMYDLCTRYPEHCLPALGLHPCSVKENYQECLEDMFANMDDKVIAIGEVGTDLYWDKTFGQEQQKALAYQMKKAQELALPVIIHTRDSFDQAVEVIQNFPLVKGVFHCFSGDERQLEQALSLGYYIGVGGVLTFKNAKFLQELITAVPLDRLLLETDAPYLAPVPYRGKRNESSYVRLVAEKLAELKDLSLDAVAEQTSQNAKMLFNI